MHFLCTTFGSAGDVHPMLGLAIALQALGHRATLITNGYFRATSERYRVGFEDLGTSDEYVAAVQNPDLWHPTRAFPYIWRQLIEPRLAAQYEILTDLYRPNETVCIANCFSLAALTAQDKQGLPVITAHMQPAVLWSRGDPPRLPGPYVPNWLRGVQYAIGQRFFIDPVVCPGLNRFRAGLGLPPVRRILEWYHSRWCVACLFPDWFAAPQPEWPSPRLQSDFPLWDEPEGDDLPAAVQAFLDAGTPPIAFTPGSANVHGREFFATAAEVCRRLGRRGILLTRFPEQLPAALPDGVRHFPYVPFTTLLPRCAAAVHHGGIGTTAQSLAAGIPQFIMALAHDQYDNGERVARLGVGDWVTAARFHPRTVTPRLMRLLSSDDVLQRCRGIAPRMTGRSGLATMAAAIERFVQETPPPQPLASR